MFPLHLGVCILKFPSAVLGGCPRGLSLLGLMSNTHMLNSIAFPDALDKVV